MDVILHLTHDCQLDCSYCYGGRKRQSAMPWRVARRAVELFLERSSSDTPALLSFFGGEPLLEFPLLQRCVDLAESGSAGASGAVRMAITTNGLLLDEGRADYLLDHAVEPTLSFDGVAPAQDACRRYRDGRSSFSDTEAALDLLLERFPGLAVCAVVSPDNVAYLSAGFDFLLSRGVRRILLNPDFFSHWDESSLDLWRQGYERVAARFEEEFVAGRTLQVNFLTAKIVAHLKGGYGEGECCDFGAKELAVAPSGNIYPCQRMVGEDTGELGLLGNVFDGLVRSECDALATCREVTSVECLQCDLRGRCRNWCSCVNQRLTGRYDRVGPLVCFHERMAIEIADRAASRLFAEKCPTFMETFYFEEAVSPEWI